MCVCVYTRTHVCMRERKREEVGMYVVIHNVYACVATLLFFSSFFHFLFVFNWASPADKRSKKIKKKSKNKYGVDIQWKKGNYYNGSCEKAQMYFLQFSSEYCSPCWPTPASLWRGRGETFNEKRLKCARYACVKPVVQVSTPATLWRQVKTKL